jgi:hypothetical protein
MANVNPNSINSFISGFNGGLRPNRFLVVGTFPQLSGLSNNTDQFIYHVRGANIPGSDLSEIPVAYRGREFKIPGNRTYSTWQMTIIDDVQYSLWSNFHKWSNAINNHVNNIPDSTAITNFNFTQIMQDWTVQQLDINGNCTRAVKLIGCWPSIISEISFLMDENESFCTFTVDMEYQYFIKTNCATTSTP